ncbi:unnamed protein product [Schistocephalus solidus]|uniref:Mediator of RNA polymerase II transcription subunit 31 n=1 Tax=Schistocephalus solidus TaxID=70667 RepID=A0A3P7EY01_SCHSO|nr:unnamed protein product [Schistocephalus solidus]
MEFVQCLGNPNYLNFLAQQGCFDKPEFINYLAYLKYWKEPAYSKYLLFPYCLHMLDLLQSPEFRREIARAPSARFIDDQVLLHWQSYLRKRSELISKHIEELGASANSV